MKTVPCHRFSVLLVDDSAVVRERLSSLLTEHKCVRRLIQAANCAAAWTLFTKFAPEVVLLDVHLPDGSGLEVLSRIKKAAPATFVIVMTNWCEMIFRQESQRRGADHFLHKATEFERVADLIEQYANQHGPADLPSERAKCP